MNAVHAMPIRYKVPAKGVSTLCGMPTTKVLVSPSSLNTTCRRCQRCLGWPREVIADENGWTIVWWNNRRERQLMEPDLKPKVAAKGKEPAKAPSPYPPRPHDETEAQFKERLKGRNSAQVTRIDFLRGAAYEYLAGGERRDTLVKAGLGTDAERREFHKRQVCLATQTGGITVPSEVLADYPGLVKKPKPRCNQGGGGND